MIQKGQVAVVTGAASGIGKAIASNLAARQVDLALVDINLEGLEKTREELAALAGVKISVHTTDVTSKDAIETMVSNVISEHGKVNYLFNNAGTTLDKSFDGHTLSDWEFMLKLNLWSVIYGCEFFIPHLLKQESAAIINTSSLAGFLGIPVQSSYCVTKAAVKALSESLFAEYRGQGLHVLSVHPGATATSIFDAAIEKAEDPDASKKLFHLVSKVAISPDKAASRIVKALDKKKQRVVIGMDAKGVELIKRLFPVGIHYLFAFAYKKLRPSSTT